MRLSAFHWTANEQCREQCRGMLKKASSNEMHQTEWRATIGTETFRADSSEAPIKHCTSWKNMQFICCNIEETLTGIHCWMLQHCFLYHESAEAYNQPSLHHGQLHRTSCGRKKKKKESYLVAHNSFCKSSNIQMHYQIIYAATVLQWTKIRMQHIHIYMTLSE